VIVSRAAPTLVQNLFQSEVPEIYDGTVSIRAIAREAGERTKIAVQSRDKDVDPVGACVGMKGMRVQSIIRELRGEKIDIIEYSDEITTFAEKALQPAKVSKVSIADLNEKQLEVIVDDTQLSLAIGKKGQNVRLAAKLLGWKIDIKSEEEKRQEVEQQMTGMGVGVSTPIEQIVELGDTIQEKLIAAGVTTVEQLADMTPEQLEEIPGIGEKTLEKISVAVRHYFGQYEEGEERPEPAVTSADQPHPNVETAEEPKGDGDTAEVTEGEGSMAKTPEELIAEDGSAVGDVEEVRDVSTEEIANSEEAQSETDAYTDADARVEAIELDNDATDQLVAESQEVSDEVIDADEHDRG
jgi:N utilization substance protein A